MAPTDFVSQRITVPALGKYEVRLRFHPDLIKVWAYSTLATGINIRLSGMAGGAPIPLVARGPIDLPGLTANQVIEFESLEAANQDLLVIAQRGLLPTVLNTPEITSVAPPGSGNLEIIEQIVLTGSQTTIDFDAIPQTFEGLILKYALKTDRAGQTSDTVRCRINLDTSASYDTLYAQFRHSATWLTTETIAGTSLALGEAAAASSPANVYNMGVVDIPFYRKNTINKVVINALGGMFLILSSTNMRTISTYSQWRSLAAINQLTLLPTVGPNFVSGSVATLYGYGI